jgi:hypothetical protein
MDGWGLTLADIPSGATIIFNIAGNTRSWGNGGMLPTHKFKIVYNFYEATSVTLSKDVQGSVLIPNRSSTTYLTGNIDGRFICGGNFEHNGGGIEIHNYQFTGTLPKPPSPFPINLIGMHLQSKDNGVSIIWETASEENNDYFTIEHSVDNTNWDIISTTKGAGNSSTPITYEAIDYNPSLGVNYYRLKQTDYDGKSETFTTRSINIKSNSTSLQIYPNPSSDYVNVIGQNFSISDFHIYDITGKSINSEVVISSIDDSTYKIDISKLKSGIYLIRYLNLSKMITKL